MAASRARWLITASKTGRGGNAAPTLLKWRKLATPGVTDLSYGTSSGNGPARRMQSAGRGLSAACQIPLLVPLHIEVVGIEPALEGCLERRPFAVEDREPAGVAVAG